MIKNILLLVELFLLFWGEMGKINGIKKLLLFFWYCEIIYYSFLWFIEKGYIKGNMGNLCLVF